MQRSAGVRTDAGIHRRPAFEEIFHDAVVTRADGNHQRDRRTASGVDVRLTIHRPGIDLFRVEGKLEIIWHRGGTRRFCLEALQILPLFHQPPHHLY